LLPDAEENKPGHSIDQYEMTRFQLRQ